MLNDDLRYATEGAEPEKVAGDVSDEYAFLKIRYKEPDSDTSQLITTPVTDRNAVAGLDRAGDDIRFSVAVAAFGQKLRSSEAIAGFSFDEVGRLAAGARGADPYGYRSEFLSLVRLAGSLSPDDAERR